MTLLRDESLVFHAMLIPVRSAMLSDIKRRAHGIKRGVAGLTDLDIQPNEDHNSHITSVQLAR
jgi:hypothetical protein